MRTFPALLVLAFGAPSFAGNEGGSSPVEKVQPANLTEDTLPEFPPDPSFDPSYKIERIEVRGNSKTKTALILREIGLFAGDIVTANDPRVGLARLRLLALGFFLDVHLSLIKGQQRGQASLVVEVEERGTIILDAIYLGTSQATDIWGGLAATERNLLGSGLSLGGGIVASSKPKVDGSDAGFAGGLHIAGPPAFFSGRLALQGAFNASHGSEFFRARGKDSSADPADFVAANISRLGGTLGVGRALSRTFFLMGEVRFESIEADLPADRNHITPDGRSTAIPFAIREGESHLGSLCLTLDIDSRSDPVLPRSGHHLSLSVEAASSAVASSYGFVKGVVQSASYLPLRWGHVIGIHGFLGGIWGDAPYFDRFFVGDLNQLLPPRALGLNFSTQPSRDFLGTGIAARRYDNLAGRVLVEYAVPLWSRHGLLYRGDAFIAFGLLALSNPDDIKNRDVAWSRAIATDLTADLGIRLDTYIGIFTLSVGNVIGRIPF
jgi:outer membrane protein insertion porin family